MGKAAGRGYVRNSSGAATADWVSSGRYHLDVMGRKVEVAPSWGPILSRTDNVQVKTT